jgi:hypothetical protein
MNTYVARLFPLLTVLLVLTACSSTHSNNGAADTVPLPVLYGYGMADADSQTAAEEIARELASENIAAVVRGLAFTWIADGEGFARGRYAFSVDNAVVGVRKDKSVRLYTWTDNGKTKYRALVRVSYNGDSVSPPPGLPMKTARFRTARLPMDLGATLGRGVAEAFPGKVMTGRIYLTAFKIDYREGKPEVDVSVEYVIEASAR